MSLPGRSLLNRGEESPLRRWVVAAGLFVPVVILAVVMLRTYRVERQYAATSQHVVREYAAIAAWQFARLANMLLHEQAIQALAIVGTAGTGESQTLIPPARILAAVPDSIAHH